MGNGQARDYDSRDASQPADGTRDRNVSYVRRRARAEQAGDGTHEPSVPTPDAPRHPQAEPIARQRNERQGSPGKIGFVWKLTASLTLPFLAGFLIDRGMGTLPMGSVAGMIAGLVLSGLRWRRHRRQWLQNLHTV